MIVKTLHFSQTFQKYTSTGRIKTNIFANIRPRSVLKISNSASISEGRLLVDEFDPKIPVEKAATPPSSWYTNPSFLELELDRVFHRGWQVAGMTPSGHLDFGTVTKLIRIKCDFNTFLYWNSLPLSEFKSNSTFISLLILCVCMWCSMLMFWFWSTL